MTDNPGEQGTGAHEAELNLQQEVLVEWNEHPPGHDQPVPQQQGEVDAVFAEVKPEPSVLSAMLGLHVSSMLLKDLLKGDPPVEDDKARTKRHRGDCCG